MDDRGTSAPSGVRDALARALSRHPLDGVVVHEAVRDVDGRPVDMRIAYVNGTGVRSAGRDLTGLTLTQAYGPDSVLLPTMIDVLATGRQAETEVTYDGDAQDPVLHHRTFTAVLTPAGADTVVVQYRDVSAERELVRRLEHQAGHDELTGLANRRLAYEHLARALVRRPRDDGQGVLVVLGDLDGFKAVNDAHGHATGDAVLREVADRLRAAARVEDLVARVGGDEFLVLCDPVRADDVPGLVERLRSSVGPGDGLPGALVVGDGGRLGTGHGVSLGVGWAWTAHAVDPDVLVAEADALLLRGKSARPDGRAAGEVRQAGGMTRPV